MKGLIIKSKWVDLILEGYKTLEIRGRKTSIRGEIGIIKSGTKQIFGTVNIFECIELTEDKFKYFEKYHQLKISYKELLNIYPKPYGWMLKDIKKYDTPLYYNHKQGCVIWVNI